MHRVVFGEYVPFADRFPWLQQLTPLPVSLDAGQRPAAFDVGGLRVAPNICFETVLSHVIRGQILALRGEGTEPDVLVNLTNDGWFLGSSELDLHLICGVFRAVECRKPLLIAANTGFSAFVDGDGRIVHRGRRRATDAILAEVRPDPRGSWYLDHGDWPAALCLAACAAFAMVGIWQRVRRRV
jgi:apolipoprotein N-acyltransferase